LARIVDEKCLLLFCTEETIYNEIMQSMTTQKLNTPTLYSLAMKSPRNRVGVPGGDPNVE